MRADAFAAWVGAVIGISAGIFTLLVVMPLLKRNINNAEARATKCECLPNPVALCCSKAQGCSIAHYLPQHMHCFPHQS